MVPAAVRLLSCVVLIRFGAACREAATQADAAGTTPPTATADSTSAAGSGETASAVAQAANSSPSVAAERPLRVVVLGDSLTAGLGLEAAEAYPARLEESLRRRGFAVEVVNAGVSGDTSAGGLARLDWILAQRPDVLIVELGVNDGLRGLPPEHTEANLREIVGRARSAGVRILFAGMRLPPSYGAEYVTAFEAIFPQLARELDVPIVPFLLAGVAGRPELNQPDGVHPTAAGHARIAETVRPHLEAILRQRAAPPPVG